MRKSKYPPDLPERRLCGQMRPRLSDCRWCIHRDECPWYTAVAGGRQPAGQGRRDL
mgnify:CR=1 FL=1